MWAVLAQVVHMTDAILAGDDSKDTHIPILQPRLI
jgi:hypothetical protein